MYLAELDLDLLVGHSQGLLVGLDGLVLLHSARLAVAMPRARIGVSVHVQIHLHLHPEGITTLMRTLGMALSGAHEKQSIQARALSSPEISST